MINAIDVFAATNVIGKNAFKCRLCNDIFSVICNSFVALKRKNWTAHFCYSTVETVMRIKTFFAGSGS